MKYLILTLTFIGIVIFPRSSQNSFVQVLSNNEKARFYVMVPCSKLTHETYFITTNDKLYLYYKNYGTKHASTYQDFLNKVFEQKVKIDFRTNNYFLLKKENSLINKEYKQYGLNYIKDKYLKYIGIEWRNKDSSSKINDAVIKIMVENFYIVYFSKYSGFFSFKTPLLVVQILLCFSNVFLAIIANQLRKSLNHLLPLPTCIKISCRVFYLRCCGQAVP
jgi:hypothetical protein